MRRLKLVVATSVIVAVLLSAAAAFAASPQWSQLMSGPQHTGYTNVVGLSTMPNIGWSAKLDSNVWNTYTQPVIGADGTVYCASDSGLYAYTSAGVPVWSKLDSTAMAFNDDVVPAIGPEGNLYAAYTATTLNRKNQQVVTYNVGAFAADGTLKWSKPLPGSFGFENCGITVDSTGRVFVGTNNGINAFTAAGKQLWAVTGIGRTVSVSPDNKYVYAFGKAADGASRSVKKLDAARGTLVASSNLPVDIYFDTLTALTIGPNGMVYTVCAFPDRVIALNPDLTLAWEWMTPANRYARYSNVGLGADGGLRVVLEGGGSEFGGGFLQCLDAATGAERWTYAGPDGTDVCCSKVSIDAEGKAYFTLYGTYVPALSYLTCVDANGNEVWLWNPEGAESYQNAPAIAADGTLFYYCLGNGTLYHLQ